MQDALKPPWMKDLEARDPQLEARLKRHWSEPHVSAMLYSRQRRYALGAEVITKTRIYLDQRYWIYCRDVLMGRPQRPIHTDIWNMLVSLVSSGRAVCPVSLAVLEETCKQADVNTRRQTAKAIDLLSAQVAIQPTDVLIDTELYHLWMSRTRKDVKLYPREQLVWNYAGWTPGELFYRHDHFSQEMNDSLQKGLYDTMAALPFSSIIESTVNAKPASGLDVREYYQNINADCKAHQDEVTSFDAVFASEVLGALDVLRPIFCEFILERFAADTTDSPPALESPEVQTAGLSLAATIYEAYKTKRWTTEFPYVHILAGLHAATRYRRQSFSQGDLMDHHHAHAALAYCNVFLTEKHLGNLLTNRPLELARLYKCRVLWDDIAILDCLRAL